MRVPFVVRWPGRVKAGAVSSVPVYFADVFANLVRAPETLGQSLAAIPGVAGAHIMAPGNEAAIAGVIADAGAMKLKAAKRSPMG